MNLRELLERIYADIPKIMLQKGKALKPLSLNLILSYACNTKVSNMFLS